MEKERERERTNCRQSADHCGLKISSGKHEAFHGVQNHFNIFELR